jgi:predicted CopG family antitoxin
VSDRTKHIPVTEERWRELRDLKAEDQSYDDLLGTLVQEHLRRRLTDPIREREREGDRYEDDGIEPQVRVEESD